MQLYPEQMQEAAEFLSRYPSVPIVIDHLGSPYDQTVEGMALWQAGIVTLQSGHKDQHAVGRDKS